MINIKNIIDYAEQEMRDFSEKEFCDVDSLVLSQISYIFFDGIVPGINTFKKPVRLKDTFLAEQMPSMMNDVRAPEENKRLLIALAGSPRYRNIYMNYYVNEFDVDNEKQFSAVTFLLDKKTAYVAFRGTDSTIVGWKEDLNMAFLNEVPSQGRATQYINKLARKLPHNIIIGGHSKGGNLAVYSAIMCNPKVQKRIIGVYSHDGPGFRGNILENEQYHCIKDRIFKTVPQSAIIGMLLEDRDDYTVIKSNRMGIMQHDPFSWEITEDGFSELEQVSGSARFMDRAMHDWISKLSDADRERFVETLFQVIKATNATTVNDLQHIKLKDIGTIVSLLGNIDADTRKFLMEALKSLVVLSFANLKPHAEKAG